MPLRKAILHQSQSNLHLISKQSSLSKTYLSKTDDDFWQNNPLRADILKDFDIDVYIQDGNVISLGNKSIYVFETPGHFIKNHRQQFQTVACLISVIFQSCSVFYNKDFWKLENIQDGNVISLGNKSIYVFETPGHTPGGLSYTLDVSENGKEYKAALWGGGLFCQKSSSVLERYVFAP